MGRTTTAGSASKGFTVIWSKSVFNCSVKLNDAILSAVACASRCMVALADGTVAIFARQADGQWDFTQYWLLTLGDPKCSGTFYFEFTFFTITSVLVSY